MPSNTKFLENVENLLSKYEIEEKCGILFKLERGKDPLEILGVLDFLKYKIENWGNTNIFSLKGSLFDKDTILVIGSNNPQEAISIIKYIYLSQIMKSKEDIENLSDMTTDELDFFLSEEISNNLKIGYPSQPKIEEQLTNHLKNILKSKK